MKTLTLTECVQFLREAREILEENDIALNKEILEMFLYEFKAYRKHMPDALTWFDIRHAARQTVNGFLADMHGAAM